MSSSNSEKTKQTDEPTTIASVNKKLEESLSAFNYKITALEERLSTIENNREDDRSLAQERHDTLEKYLLALLGKSEKTELRETIAADTTKARVESRPVEETIDLNVSDTSYAKDKKSLPRNASGRLQMLTKSDQRKDLSPGEAFVKKAWPEAIFPDDIDDQSYTSVKNKIVLKPEWRLVEANSEVFTKLTRIQTALQMALVLYHLWGH